MDVGKKYIEMCEKAEEIQKHWKPHEGDIIQIRNRELVSWLPKQDQLQEMVFENWGSPELIDGFHQWYYDLFKESNKNYQCEAEWSMEQLWLAFVMKEKYNKEWNGESWE